MTSKKSSVMSELQKVQDIIQHTYHRISVLEKIVAQNITVDDRESIEAELIATLKVLKNNEEKLLKLRKDNTKSFMIAACLIFIIFLLFGLYSMYFNIYK